MEKTTVKTKAVGIKQRGQDKMSRIPVKILPTENAQPKPSWIKTTYSNNPKYVEVKELLRKNNLHSVCEEASCPNIYECFSKGTATFMIMGDICTRRCAFCDVAHGRPNKLDPNEPENLANAIAKLGLKYVVITSVDRDDLLDGGAKHFQECITKIKQLLPDISIEVLVPDFRGRLIKALDEFIPTTIDVFNHNIETVPELYKAIRPGSDYQHSLDLLRQYKERYPGTVTKSGLMLGLGETDEQVELLLQDLFASKVDLVTIGQYLAPSKYHAPVKRYVTPEQFLKFKKFGEQLGFRNVASGPMVRSSYHAENQYKL
jgi:lipoic acid synthetase